MPAIYVYECLIHKRFEIPLRFGSDIPTTWPCPAQNVDEVNYENLGVCGEDSRRIIMPPSGVIVKGGTGGGKDMHLVR